MLTRVLGSRKQNHFNWRHIFFRDDEIWGELFFLNGSSQFCIKAQHLLRIYLWISIPHGAPCLWETVPGLHPLDFFKKRKSTFLFQTGSYRNMLLIYNTSHNNRHQTQGEKFVSPLAWCAHTRTQNTTLQTPLSNQCEDFIGMCHFGCTTAVLHTHTHVHTSPKQSFTHTNLHP